MKVSDWIHSHPANPVTVGPDQQMAAVATTFLSHPHLRDIYVVSPEGAVLGFIRHRRLAHLLLAEHRPVHSSHQLIERVSGGTAGELMEADFVSAHPDEALDNVLNRMLEYEVEDMPVLDDRKCIVGNINLTEILRAVNAGEI